MVYAWQWNVYLEELMYGLAWPASARGRHRPLEQSCDEYNEYEYAICNITFTLCTLI